jgi:hypothetical protein
MVCKKKLSNIIKRLEKKVKIEWYLINFKYILN